MFYDCKILCKYNHKILNKKNDISEKIYNHLFYLLQYIQSLFLHKKLNNYRIKFLQLSIIISIVI